MDTWWSKTAHKRFFNSCDLYIVLKFGNHAFGLMALIVLTSKSKATDYRKPITDYWCHVAPDHTKTK